MDGRPAGVPNGGPDDARGTDRVGRPGGEVLARGRPPLIPLDGFVGRGRAMTGRATECVALARQVGATARRLGQTPILAGCELIEGIAHAFTGDRDTAEAHLSHAEHLAPEDADLHAGAWGIGRGVGALVMEDRDGARRALQRARQAAPERHARILDAALGPAMLLDAMTGQTGPADLDPLMEAMVRGARWHELWLGAAVAVASAYHRDVPAAEAALAAALTAGGPYPLFGALVRRLVAEAAIHTAFIDPAPLLRDAETAFTTLGLPRPAAAVRGLLRGLGEAAPRRRRGDGPIDPHLLRLGVTAREAEVLLLLADRLTNRQIAQRLYVSPKTVEKHVAALARKLGARDRVELAEVARTRGRSQAG
jgi:DNA-binding CsgD family transcriptional regulator